MNWIDKQDLSNLDKHYLELELLVESIDTTWSQEDILNLSEFMNDFYDEYTDLTDKVNNMVL